MVLFAVGIVGGLPELAVVHSPICPSAFALPQGPASQTFHLLSAAPTLPNPALNTALARGLAGWSPQPPSTPLSVEPYAFTAHPEVPAGGGEGARNGVTCQLSSEAEAEPLRPRDPFIFWKLDFEPLEP